jgi:membrane-associated phospholipid phosphatase
MDFLTDFADQAVVLPLAGAMLLVLAALGWRRGALAWGGSVAGVLAAMLLLKLVVVACGARWGLAGLTSPSGHTAGAAVVFGGLLALLLPRSSVWVAAGAGGAFALAIGLTRLALQVHTVADVVVGAAVGVAGAVAMRLLAGPRPAAVGPRWVLLAAALVVVVFHGQRLPAEGEIRWLALGIWPLDECR